MNSIPDSWEEDGERTVMRPNMSPLLHDPADEMLHVLVLQPSGGRPPIRLYPGALTLGRAQPADIVLPGSEVSRRHCRFDLVGETEIAGGGVLLTDLNSTNGTYVDGTRLAGTVALSPGALISVGGHHLRYERRGRNALDEAERMERELRHAGRHVLAILPLPLREGPVRAEWFYQPGARLGGVAFTYRDLGNGAFAGGMIGVAGEGAAAAMHAVGLAGMLRDDAVLGADPRDPAAVLARLHATFPAETHGGMTAAAWYWAYQPASRTLLHGGAGGHKALLVDRAGGKTAWLASGSPPIGAAASCPATPCFATSRCRLPAGAELYLFSPAVFGFPRRDAESSWELDDVAATVLAPPVPGLTEPQRLYDAIREAARPGLPDGDLAIVTLSFP